MVEVEDLVSLCDGGKQWIVASQSFLLLVESDRGAFGMAFGTEHRAIKIESDSRAVLSGKAVEDQGAIERIRKGFSPYPHDPNAPKNSGGVPDKFTNQLALAGTPEEVREQVERMAEVSGFDTIVLNTQASADLDDSLKLFAEGVIAPLN